MSSNAEYVTDFRSTVDTAVNVHRTAERASRTLRPRGGMGARLGAFTFYSLNKSDGRPAALRFSDEHIWVVIQDNVSVNGRVGQFAIQSVGGQDDTLKRSWYIPSAMPQVGIYTEKTITEQGDLANLANWARSPHLVADGLESIQALDESETAKVTERLAELSASQRSLEADLSALADARARAAANAHNVWVR